MATIQLNPRTDYEGINGCQILAILYTGEPRPTKIGLKTKVYLSNWDKDLQEAIFIAGGRYTIKKVKELNEAINSEVNKIRLVISNIQLENKELVGANIKTKFLQTIGKRRKDIDQEEKLNTAIIKLYEPFQSEFAYRNGHRTTYQSYLAFEKDSRRFRIGDIGFGFLKKYAKWLESDNKSDSTIGLRIRMMKAFINSEIRNIYKGIDLSYEKYNYEILDKAIVRLTQEEFHKLLYIEDLTKEQKVKLDWFILITAIGGLRISSAKKLFRESFNQSEKTVTYIEIKRKGGTKEIVNPLNFYALKILERYQWNMPKLTSGQRFNDSLQTIAEKINYNRIITEDKKIGGKIQATQTPLHKFFTSKLARKTFTSICADLNIDRLISNAMSNHSINTGSSSDAYRDKAETNLLSHKRREMEKWYDMYKEWNRKYPDPVLEKEWDDLIMKSGGTSHSPKD